MLHTQTHTHTPSHPTHSNLNENARNIYEISPLLMSFYSKETLTLSLYVCMRLAWCIFYFFLFIHRQPRWIYFNGVSRLDVSCARTAICDTRQSKVLRTEPNITTIKYHTRWNFNDHFEKSINFIACIILNCDFFSRKFELKLICVFKLAKIIFSTNI